MATNSTTTNSKPQEATMENFSAKTMSVSYVNAKGQTVTYGYTKNVKPVKAEFDPQLYIPQVDPNYYRYGDVEFLEDIIKTGIFLPVYIYGEAGVGKTTDIEQICARLKKPMFRCQITESIDSESIIGGLSLLNGDVVWQDGPVTMAMRCGGVLILDEFDINPTLMILQGVLEGKPLLIKETNELVYPKKGFCVFATGNSKGDGNGAEEYIGTQAMNRAQLDRFARFIHKDIPSIEVESVIIETRISNDNIDIEEADKAQLIAWVDQCRQAYQQAGEVGYLSTRKIQQILTIYDLPMKACPKNPRGQTPKFKHANMLKSVEYVLSEFTDAQAEAMFKIFKACKPATTTNP